MMRNALRRLLRRSRQAKVCAEQPVETRPASQAERAQSLYREAIACSERGDPVKAEQLLGESIQARHDFAEAHLLLAQLMRRQGRLEDAADCCVMAACFRPDLAEPHFELGLIALDQGDWASALAPLAKALSLDPLNARLHNAMGAALLNQERIVDARAHFERAVELAPNQPEAHSNLGYLLVRDYEEFEQGESHLRRALELAPEDANALCNWTMVLERLGKHGELISLCDRLLAQHPDLHAARLNRGLALLKLGEFASGWLDYEARKQVRCNYVPQHLPWPEWDGSALTGRRIYIHAEQGMGDQIMFASCIPDVLKDASACVLECNPKLVRLFQRSFPDVIIRKETPWQQLTAGELDVDCQCAMGTLPRFFRNTLSDFPRHAGYLKADPARIAYWRTRLRALPGAMKVGISWRGGLKSTRQSSRSIPLELWLPILRVPGVDFVDLQYFDCAEEVKKVESESAASLHRWMEALGDYEETAALVCALDLVISVQTALVHLTGALGRPAWALISATPEWRYLARGETLPWYPSVRLMRQEQLGDWQSVIQHTAQMLIHGVEPMRQPVAPGAR